MNWSQDRVKGVLVNMAMHLGAQYKTGNSLTSGATFGFYEAVLPQGFR
jgi:hypothetical protein